VVTKEPFLFFGVACLIYLVFSLVSAAGIAALERRSNRGFATGAGGGR
jgi:polar amino acid transport system permease protein